MQSLSRFTQGWQAVVGKFIGVRRTRRWLLPAVILVLALGIGITHSTWVVLAQEQTGQGDQVTYNLDYQRTPEADPICIGQTLQLSAVVIQNTRFSGERITHTGHAIQTLRATAINTRVLAPRTSLETFLTTYVPLSTRRREFTFEARAAGTTSIEIDARVLDFANNSNPSGEYFPYHASIRVQVVPCEYRVDVNTLWDTSMHNASTVLVATAHDLRLIRDSTAEGRTLRFDPTVAGAPSLGWTWAMNRMRGCLAGIGYFPDRAPQITANIGEENLTLTMTYSEVAPPINGYYNQLCLPYHAGEPCSSRPDGACWTMPPDRPYDFFRPQSPAGSMSVPLNGGTISTTQRITHSYGSATGTIHITVTPVLPGQ